MKPFYEKYRTKISQLVGLIAILTIVFTQSAWEEESKLFSYVLFCLGVFLVAIASLGRMWCSLYIAGYKNSKLITQGPYSITRNPLYFFSFIGLIGVGLATETLTYPIIFILFFALYYPSVIKQEQKRLKEIFGQSYEEYMKTTPAFFPDVSKYSEPESYVVNPKIYKEHIFSALWFIWLVGILEIIEGLKDVGYVSHIWSVY